MSNILNQIEREFDNIEAVREKLFEPKLIQLHTGNEMFDSPDAFGVYKNSGGAALGVVGSRYSPMNLEIMLESIVQSVMSCDVNIDLSTLDFKEYHGGKKVAFTLALPTTEIKGSPMVGDVIKRRLEFRTGFDGLTKTSITEYMYRLWCSNGASSPHSQVGRMASLRIDSNELDSFIKKVTGLSAKDYKTMSAQSRTMLDAINRSVAIEMSNTGDNLFSVVNGFTRYATHDKSNKNEEKLLYSSVNTLVQNTFSAALAQLN